MGPVRKTIGQMLEEVSQEYSGNHALVHTETGARYNYGLLSWEVDRVALGLIDAGIQKGDRVAIWAPNIPEWITAFLALARIGAVAVPIDPDADRDDLHFILVQSECRAMIVSRGLEVEEYVEMILYERDRVPSLENIFAVSDKTFPEIIPWSELTAIGGESDRGLLREKADAVAAEDPVAIMYTSGTTGRPKGVELDHLGLINKSICSAERQGLTPEDRLCLFLPLFHMFGNTCVALAGLLRGATLVMPCQIFEPSLILKAIYKEKCTAIYGSPSMLAGLIEHPEFKLSRLKTLAKGTVGGAPCPEKLMRRLVEDVGVSGLTVAYGITETSSWITMTDPDDSIGLKASTIGRPLDCNEVKIVDPVTGEGLHPGGRGELCTRGLLMKGYYKMPAATAAAIDRSGWFHTGDLGEMDESGYVKITGRLTDVITREGVEIHPIEVEEVLHMVPGVLEAQVFGFPHPEMGQEVAAWIRMKEGNQSNLIEIVAHAKDHLDVETMPRYFKVVTDFPMTRSGKVQKFKLAEMAYKEYLDEKS